MIGETRLTSSFRSYCSDTATTFRAMSTPWKILTVSSTLVLGIALPVIGGVLAFIGLTNWHKKHVVHITQNVSKNPKVAVIKDVSYSVISTKPRETVPLARAPSLQMSHTKKPHKEKSHSSHHKKSHTAKVERSEESEQPSSQELGLESPASIGAPSPISVTEQAPISVPPESETSSSPLRGRLISWGTVYQKEDATPIQIEITQKSGEKKAGTKHVSLFEAQISDSSEVIAYMVTKTVTTDYAFIPKEEGYDKSSKKVFIGKDGLVSQRSTELRGVATALIHALIRKSTTFGRSHYKRIVVDATGEGAGFLYKLGFRCITDPIKEAEMADIDTHREAKYGADWANRLQSLSLLPPQENHTDEFLGKKIEGGERASVNNVLMYLPKKSYKTLKQKLCDEKPKGIALKVFGRSVSLSAINKGRK